MCSALSAELISFGSNRPLFKATKAKMGALNKERFLFSQVDFYGQFLQSERGARVEAKQ